MGWRLANLRALRRCELPASVLHDEDVSVATAKTEYRFAGAKAHFGAAHDDGGIARIAARFAFDGIDRLELDLTLTDRGEKIGFCNFGAC